MLKKQPLKFKGVNINRREFVKKSMALLPFVGVGSFLYPLSKFSFFEEKQTISAVVNIEELTHKVTKKGTIFITKFNDEIKIFDAHCTHMGCLLNFNENENVFVCPCHSSKFNLDGSVLKGPAQKKLDTISYKISNKNLLIS